MLGSVSLAADLRYSFNKVLTKEISFPRIFLGYIMRWVYRVNDVMYVKLDNYLLLKVILILPRQIRRKL